MKKIIAFAFMGLFLTSCSYFSLHKMDIEQGNIITPAKVNTLHPGMTADQVRNIMGNPLFVNIFSSDRMDYVYTYQPSHGKRTETRVACIFQQGVLKEIKQN